LSLIVFIIKKRGVDVNTIVGLEDGVIIRGGVDKQAATVVMEGKRVEVSLFFYLVDVFYTKTHLSCYYKGEWC
jgi:hypothetical protein